MHMCISIPGHLDILVSNLFYLIVFCEKVLFNYFYNVCDILYVHNGSILVKYELSSKTVKKIDKALHLNLALITIQVKTMLHDKCSALLSSRKIMSKLKKAFIPN